ncbi:MAG: hypothetical protein K6E29_01920 [Cyanobacteria bacterium RUI128]|nr:hypothetical protein [Cyanobacteria bacterium RUI128]
MIIKIGLFAIVVISCAALWFLHRRNELLRKKYDNITEYFGDVNTIVNSVRYGNLSVRAETYSQEELAKLTDNINRMIETLNDREKMIVEYQAELTKKNHFLYALVNSLSDGILVCDEKCVIIDANKNIKRWLKNPKILKSKFGEYITIPNGKNISELNDDEVFLKENKDSFFRATTSILDSEEHKGKYMVVISDCTNQKEIESLKEDFIATLTHDLKVPIIAEANMLDFFLSEKFGKISEKQKEALNTMKMSNKELLDLVQTVLDTYKVKEGEIDLNPEKVSVKNLLNEVIEEMEPIAQKNGNNLVLNLKTDYKVKVDFIQIKRVLKNLVSNAISYGKAGSNIDITAKDKSDFSIISVKDYGKGISKEDIDKVFNKYYSAHKKFRKIGTGLGLYLSKKLVNAHGGDLSVTSKEGEYTEFIIKLPHTSA